MASPASTPGSSLRQRPITRSSAAAAAAASTPTSPSKDVHEHDAATHNHAARSHGSSGVTSPLQQQQHHKSPALDAAGDHGHVPSAPLDESKPLRAKKHSGDAAAGDNTLLVAEAATKRWTGWWRRFWWTLLMIGGFFLWLYLFAHTGLVVLVLLVQAFIYRELVLLAIRYNKERELPGFNTFYYYWFFVAVFFMYGRTLMAHFQYHDPRGAFAFILEHHMIISWGLYMMGVMAFVGSLKKRKLYRYQFSQLAYCHMALLVVVGQSTYLAANVFQGIIWFMLPCSMVVCNDCFAYIFGFFMGRTPLIRLSPKKTWEGFLGGFLMTMIFAFFWTRLLQAYPFMTCPKIGFGLGSVQCDVTAPGLATVYRLTAVQNLISPSLATALPEWILNLQVSRLQLHAICMAVVASLVAPFGGFFASGFKRAFSIKDFGDVIPGHGGFTDRMDCQIVMGAFTYMYLFNVIGVDGPSVDSVLAAAMTLTTGQQTELLAKLTEAVTRNAAIPH